MKGLLIKDLQLLKNQKTLFLLSIIISVFFVFNKTTNMTFITCYLTILFSSASVSVISMDQQEKGMSFLMTLPVSRSSYVKGKYLLGILMAGISLAAVLLLMSLQVLTTHRFPDADLLLVSCLASAVCSLLMHAVMIPLYLKFTAEKIRMVIILLMGMFYVILFGLSYLIKNSHIDLSGFQQQISRMHPAVISLILCAAMIMLLVISFLISLRIVKKKEF